MERKIVHCPNCFSIKIEWESEAVGTMECLVCGHIWQAYPSTVGRILYECYGGGFHKRGLSDGMWLDSVTNEKRFKGDKYRNCDGSIKDCLDYENSYDKNCLLSLFEDVLSKKVEGEGIKTVSNIIYKAVLHLCKQSDLFKEIKLDNVENRQVDAGEHLAIRIADRVCRELKKIRLKKGT